MDSLAEIYTENFRHSYSQISQKLRDLESDERDIVSESMEQLINNLIKIEKSSKDHGKYDNLVRGINKLNDHINLEIIRIQLETVADTKLKEVIRESDKIEKSNEALTDNIDSLNNNVVDLEDKANIANTQSIAILGIFAGVVFVFTGGFSLIATGLQNINDVCIQKIVFVLSFMGMMIYDLIYLSYCMLNRIISKNEVNLRRRHSHKANKVTCSHILSAIVPNVILLILMGASLVTMIITKSC